LAEITNRLQQTLRKARNVRWGFFGYDFSYNVSPLHVTGHWQPQLYGVVSTSNRVELQQVLKSAFPAGRLVKHPIRIVPFDGSPLGVSYVFKTRFWRRSSYWARNLKPPAWNTACFSLRVRREIELALFLDKLDFEDRMIWYRLSPRIDGSDVVLERTDD
jgi:hypothetical protein